jgi:predicted NBD/HSP70 family sugar kinase
VQGIADMSTGTIAWSPAFRARDIAIRAPIERTLGVPTSIANDANLMALSVITRNPLAYAGTAAVTFVGAGVGMGLIINGRIYLGPTGAAAEFGHVIHMPSGPRCRCGRRGCIEAFAADYGIYRMAEGGDPDAEPPHRAIDPVAMRAIETRARAGDARALSAFRSAGLALGFGLARTIALLDVRRITLLGSGLRAADIIKPAIDEGLEQGLAAGLARGCVIEIGSIDHHDMAIDGLVTSLVADLDRDMIERPRADVVTEVGELT